jgi:uncharacterized protein YkwD
MLKMARKSVASLIVFILLLSAVASETAFAAGNAGLKFSDVPESHWAFRFIQEAGTKGFVKGDGDGRFRPNDRVTQAEFLAMLTNAFPDELSVETDRKTWYAPYYSIAEQLGLTYTNRDPSKLSFNRGSLAVMIYEVLMGKKPSSEEQAVNFLLSAGISSGKESATYEGYKPKDTLSRAEAVTVLYKVIEYVNQNQDGLLLNGRGPIVGKSSKAIANTALFGISLGTSVRDLTAKLGEPDRIAPTQYVYDWYIYNKEGKHLRYAVLNQEVIGFYSNSLDVFSGGYNFKIGTDMKTTTNKIIASLGGSLGYFEEDEYIMQLFYDTHASGVVDAIFIMHSQGYSRGKRDLEALYKAFEQGIFEITNAYRIKHGVDPLTWSDLARTSAYNHSKDMRINAYFDHDSLDGRSPFDRMKEVGITYASAGENIAYGYGSDILVMDGWINSAGHRQNLLYDHFTHLGVGVYDGYYTQNFYSPRNW